MQTKIIPPKIRVYHIGSVQPDPLPKPVARGRFFRSALFIIPLLVGLSGGAYLSWTSHFGQADRLAQEDQVLELRGKPEPTSTIPLEFDQSELTIVADLLPILIEQNRRDPTPEEIKAAERKEKLKKYLELHRSPLAKEDTALDALLRARNMKMILAISFVESNICKKQVGHNCSGIGGSKLKKYPNFAGWVDDFDSLLERRYKNLKVEQFIGYYVQPGSQNWVDGVYQILGDLSQRHIE